jgi:hypothetical protein
MMKATYATNLAAAMLLVVPALTFGTDAGSGLRSALSDTIRALEALTGLSDDVTEGTEGSIDRVRAMTEAPILDDQARDQYLVQLRQEVGQLRMQDELGITVASPSPLIASEVTTQTDVGTPAVAPTTQPLPFNTSATASVTTGLDDRLRLSLTSEPGTATDVGGRVAEAMEGEGFSADPMLEAQANYRAARYDHALALLGSATPGVETSWWRGRCLEKLGRLPEALTIYESIVQIELDESASDEDRSAHARVLPRAERDVEFLRWAVAFRTPLATQNGKKAGK